MTEYIADTKGYVCEKQFNNVVKCSLLGRKKRHDENTKCFLQRQRKERRERQMEKQIQEGNISKLE